MPNRSFISCSKVMIGLVNFSHSGRTTRQKTSVKQYDSKLKTTNTSESSVKMLKRSYSDVTNVSGT